MDGTVLPPYNIYIAMTPELALAGGMVEPIQKHMYTQLHFRAFASKVEME